MSAFAIFGRVRSCNSAQLACQQRRAASGGAPKAAATAAAAAVDDSLVKFAGTRFGRVVLRRLGLPAPPRLRRPTSPRFPERHAALRGARLFIAVPPSQSDPHVADCVTAVVQRSGASARVLHTSGGVGEGEGEGEGAPLRDGVVIDATSLAGELMTPASVGYALREVFDVAQGALKSCRRGARVVVVCGDTTQVRAGGRRGLGARVCVACLACLWARGWCGGRAAGALRRTCE